MNQPLGRPFKVRPVCRRHVLDDRGVSARAAVTGVAGDAATTMQQLDCASGDARIEFQTNQRVRHAVAMLVDFDVVIDMDRHGLEACEFPRLHWQRLQCRRIQLRECTGTRSGQLLEWALVQVLQQWADRVIDGLHGREPLMTQTRHDPAFNHLDCNFYFRFVRRAIYAGWKE